MDYIALEQLKNAWIFRQQALPISDEDKSKIKAMTPERSATFWLQFISKSIDHPDFFTEYDWPAKSTFWQATDDWEARWESDEPNLPESISAHLNWQDNTKVYYCNHKHSVFETDWAIFKRCWKNFLFMHDGVLLLGKKRQEVIQFFADGTFKLGQRPNNA